MTEKACVLCGEPVNDENENRMPTAIGLCHSECFRDDCGEPLFLVVEALAQRVQELETRVKELDGRTFGLIRLG